MTPQSPAQIAAAELDKKYGGTGQPDPQVPDADLEELFAADDAAPAPSGGPAFSATPAAPPSPASATPTEAAFSEADLRRHETELLRQQVEFFRQQAEKAATTAPSADDDDDSDLDLTEDENEAYSRAIPVVDKLVARRLREYDRSRVRSLEEQVRQAHQAQQATNQKVGTAEDQAFLAQVSAAVPNYQTIVKSQGWAGHLAQPVPFSGGRQIGHMLADAVRNKDAATVAEIVMSYNGGAGVSAPSSAPGKSQASLPSTTPRNGKVAYSKFLEKTEAYKRGELSSAEFTRIRDFYLERTAEGRVDYSA